MMSWSCSHSSVQAPTSSASISSSPARCPMSSARTPRSPRPAWCDRNARTQARSTTRGSGAAAGSLYIPEGCRSASHLFRSTGRPLRPSPPSASRPPEAPHRQPVELSAVTSRPQPSEKARSGGSCTTSQLMGTERGTPHRGRRALMAAHVWRVASGRQLFDSRFCNNNRSGTGPPQIGRQACKQGLVLRSEQLASRACRSAHQSTTLQPNMQPAAIQPSMQRTSHSAQSHSDTITPPSVQPTFQRRVCHPLAH